MRKHIKYVLFISFIFFFCSCSNKWKEIYKTEFDWNHDGKPDRITLGKPKDWNDPGDFHKICIKMAGKPEFVLENLEGWVINDTSSSVVKNISDSKYFLLCPITKNESALFLIGYGYASNASKLTVITLENDYPEVIFNDEMDICKYTDMNSDSIPDFILRPWLSQAYGPDDRFESYVPLFVYTLNKQNDSWKMNYDEKLSKKYTNDSLYGWIDSEPNDSNESYVVFKPKNEKKPRVMKQEDAEHLYESEKKTGSY